MNLVVFLLAGYETTSTTLAYAFHVLATIPVEQEKLINEIDEQFPNESDVSIFFSWIFMMILKMAINPFLGT